MADWRALEAALNRFEAVRETIARTSGEGAGDWRKTLIGLRRELQDGAGEMRTLLSDYEANGGDKQVCADFARALSAMRSAVALHQVEWPAVAIDVTDLAYRDSVGKLRAQGVAFTATARALIGRMRQAALTPRR